MVLTEAPRRGRPRDAARDRELLEATQDLLVEVGYDRLTIDAVAARAGAGKATVYRRWPHKSALVADAVGALHRPQATPDTGSLRDDLMTLAAAFAGNDARRAAVIAGLITAMAHDDDLHEAVHSALARPRYAEFAAVIQQAIDRGEVPADRDVALLSRLLPALAFHQVAALHAPVDTAFVTRIVDAVLLPLLTPPG